ncbi:MAG: type II toxin-antitoxin system PemK/MazF family toxin [candidate division KSB1 bacterium]|nr:type II toxin-antitoxin system PemK/MazF family toxin [candidate division KSB1 bacterium]
MQYDIYLVNPEPKFGSEPDKLRPCIVVSPDELNQYLQTVVIVPLTSSLCDWPFRALIEYDGRKSDACIDQIRVIDKQRLIKRKSRLSIQEIQSVKDLIRETYVD